MSGDLCLSICALALSCVALGASLSKPPKVCQHGYDYELSTMGDRGIRTCKPERLTERSHDRR